MTMLHLNMTLFWYPNYPQGPTMSARRRRQEAQASAGARPYAVPIVAKHWDRPPNIFGETSEYVPCGAIYWHRLANMCG